MGHLDDRMADSPAPITVFPRKRICLPKAGDYGVSLPALNPSDENSVVHVVYQVSAAAV